MGDIFEKMGNILSEKIENEKTASTQDSECKIDDSGLKIENTENNSEPETALSLSSEQLSILNSKLSIKKTATAERIPAGTYTEDVPVKIITGTASFSSSSD